MSRARMYGSDPYAYDFRAALDAARERVRARRRRPVQTQEKKQMTEPTKGGA